MTEQRKKLIEVALPLEAINAASAREKSIRHGHPSTLHLWWARRPLAACRAVIFGQMVDDPSAWPERFPTEEEQELERARLFKLIGGTKEADYKDGLVAWESSTDERMLNAARYEIARSVAWNRGEEPPTEPKAVLSYLQEQAPPIYDPFCGGGSIPLEAQRLGLRAYGSDLNPVAVLISKALVEIPPKFAGQPPVNPEAQAEIQRGGEWNGKGAQGLAEDVRYYGQWMSDEAERRIGHLYPKAEVHEAAIQQQPHLHPLKGEKFTVIAWLWVRTVASPNPAANGAHVPLVSSFMLCKKKNKKVWVQPIIDKTEEDGYRFEVYSGELSETEVKRKSMGTKSARGANFYCIVTESPIPADYVKAQGMKAGYKWRLMAVAVDGPKGRIYLPPDREHERIAKSVEPSWRPEVRLSSHPQYMSVTKYGPSRVGDLFLPRQAHALGTFCAIAQEVKDKVATDVKRQYEVLGSGIMAGAIAESYATAIQMYLGLNVSRLANRQSTSTFWHTSGEKVEQVFAMQALPMRWDTAEGNPFSTSSGNFLGQLSYLSRALDGVPALGVDNRIENKDAAAASYKGVVLATDPPYFDNVPYADLSDFFYPWLRRSLRSEFPGLFGTIEAPKNSEIVADSLRHGSAKEAEQFFLAGMQGVLSRAAGQISHGWPAAIFYAFRQSEKGEEGVSPTGWSAFLEALRNSGFIIDGTWPVRTELTGNLKKKWNALASSIVMACRVRGEENVRTTRSSLVKELKGELPVALKHLQEGNVAPVDLTQAAMGPGMAVFTRYAAVLEADDTPMSARTALEIINSELDGVLSEREAEFDAWTRFAVTWFETHGMEEGPYGDAETLATARGVSVSGVEESGLIEARAGKVRLIPREQMAAVGDPTEDGRLTVWVCTQHLIRLLEAGGEGAAARLLARLGSWGEPARDLAYRLFGICERKKWADEGRAYNGLVVVWPDLVRKAADARSRSEPQPQLDL